MLLQAFLQSVSQPAPVPPAGNAAPLDTPAAPVVDDRPQPGNLAQVPLRVLLQRCSC